MTSFTVNDFFITIENDTTLRALDCNDGTIWKAEIADVSVTEQTSSGDFLSNPAKLLAMLQAHINGERVWPCYWKAYRRKAFGVSGVSLYASNDVDGVEWILDKFIKCRKCGMECQPDYSDEHCNSCYFEREY